MKRWKREGKEEKKSQTVSEVEVVEEDPFLRADEEGEEEAEEEEEEAEELRVAFDPDRVIPVPNMLPTPSFMHVLYFCFTPSTTTNQSARRKTKEEKEKESKLEGCKAHIRCELRLSSFPSSCRR